MSVDPKETEKLVDEAMMLYHNASTVDEARDKYLEEIINHYEWTNNSSYREAQLALTRWREDHEYFVEIDAPIEGLSWQLPPEKKVELIWAQLRREMASYVQYETWVTERD